LAVTYVALRANLDGLNGSVAALLAVADQTEPGTATAIAIAIAELAKQHAGFVGGLWEKLGDNSEEPRLEWGAAYLAEQAPILSAAAQLAEQTLTKNAAAHVAEGEFGTRLEDASQDELGAFSRAFNGLSSPTRLVLGVLDRMPDSATPEQAFATLWSESRAHLGHRWQALFALEGSQRRGKLMAIQHDAGITFADQAEQFELAGIIASLALE